MAPRLLAPTPLCRQLGIALPIVQAPMAGGWTTPALAAAVSNAGGLGMLAGARISAEALRTQVQAVRALTDRPFGVNFLLAPPDPAPHDIAAVQGALLPALLGLHDPASHLPVGGGHERVHGTDRALPGLFEKGDDSLQKSLVQPLRDRGFQLSVGCPLHSTSRQRPSHEELLFLETGDYLSVNAALRNPGLGRG